MRPTHPTRSNGHIASRLRAAALVTLVVVLTGCGGGDGDEAPAASSRGSGAGTSLVDFYSCIVSALFLGPGCPGGSSSGGSSGYSNYPGPDVCVDFYCGGSGDAVYPVDLYGTPEAIPGSLDVEPNNTLATASPVASGLLDARTGLVGFDTDGLLNSLNDGVDNYIFTARSALQIVVQLCDARGPTCDEMTPESSLDVAFAHVSVLDQDGNTLATTSNDSINGNLISMSIDGGVPYYLSVVSGYATVELLPDSKRYYLRLIGAVPATAPDPAEPGTNDPGFTRPEAPHLTLSSSGQMIATLDWTAPSLNTDGAALVDLVGYALYYGDAESGSYSFRLPLDLGLSAYTLTLPDYGAWHFVLVAVNAAGVESAFSNELVLYDPPPTLP